MIGGWTKIFAPTIVNEFRAGYNYDNSKRQSTFQAADVTAQLGIENAPSLSADRLGFPSFQFTAGTNRPTNIADAGRNVDRTLRQNAFSLSDNLTWIKGGHTLKARRPLDPQHGARRVRLRRQLPRPVPVPRQRRPATPSRTSCSACRPTPAIRSRNRGPLDGHSNDFAGSRRTTGGSTRA